VAVLLQGKAGDLLDFYSRTRLRFTHRQIGDTDVYFVANKEPRAVDTVCAFRVAGKVPELWDPETGSTWPVRAYWITSNARTAAMPLRLDAFGSTLVVFRPGESPGSRKIDSIARGAEELCDTIERARGSASQSGAPNSKTALPAPIALAGPWEVHFDAAGGGPDHVRLDKLISWSNHADSGVKYYSGTATYRKTFDVPAGFLGKDRRYFLDLGRVEVMAVPRLNGRELGTLWKLPYRAEVTAALKAGTNSLEVKVVNLWINRQIGDELLAEDSDRNPDGTLRAWPKWVEEGKPSPTGRKSFHQLAAMEEVRPVGRFRPLGPGEARSGGKVGITVVPEGRMKIAQQFTAGYTGDVKVSKVP
jgi:hypothetical protein